MNRKLLVAALLLHLLPFATRPALIGGDEPHYALAAHSIATDGDVDLADDYETVAAGSRAASAKRAGQALDRHLIVRHGREVPSHPIGLPLLASPLVAVQQLLAPGAAPDLLLGLLSLSVTFLGLLALWELLTSWLGRRDGTVLTFAVTFATPVWYYSRTFFTEPYLWALGAIGLALLARGRSGAAAVAFGLLPWIKDTAALFAAGFLLLVLLIRERRETWTAAAVLAASAALFVGKNLLLYGAPFVTFQPFRYGSWLEGTLGLVAGPSHGLLWFAPVLLLAPAAVGRGNRGGVPAPAPTIAVAAFLLYFAVTASWIDWGGGSGYGPRLLVPALPLLAVPLGLAWRRHGHRRAFRLVLITLTAAGFGVNLAAATDPVSAFWNQPAGELVATHLPAFLVGAGVAAVFMARGLSSPRPDPRLG